MMNETSSFVFVSTFGQYLYIITDRNQSLHIANVQYRTSLKIFPFQTANELIVTNYVIHIQVDWIMTHPKMETKQFSLTRF